MTASGVNGLGICGYWSHSAGWIQLEVTLRNLQRVRILHGRNLFLPDGGEGVAGSDVMDDL